MASVELESLWTRLRRRKVVQWGIAYAAGAWGLLQGLAYVIETFRWPQLLQPLVTLGLLIGLPTFRLRGVYFALITFGMAQVEQAVIR